jgi:glutaconate CoA-transferase, subunit A
MARKGFPSAGRTATENTPGRRKRMSMAEAIRRFVRDGDRVYLGGFLHGEPYAAAHEIIRQGKRDLVISTAAGTILVDQLIGAGCVRGLIASYCWNPVPATTHAFRRAVEQGIPRPIELEEYSLLGISLAYFAGAMGLPFVASKTMLGSSFLSHKGFLGDGKLKVVDSPMGDERVCLIGPLHHDVGIVQLQRADSVGNAQAWGLLGPTRYGLNSCGKVIVCAEEVVDRDVILRDPGRTILAGFRACAVVEVPWGAHPSYVQGHYDRDWRYASEYATSTQTLEGFQKYIAEWVMDVGDRAGYLSKLGPRRVRSLKGKQRRSSPVNYGLYDGF